MLLACNSYDDVLNTYKLATRHLSDILSAFEMIDYSSMELTLRQIPNTRYPMSEKYQFYIVMETSGTNRLHDRQKLEDFIDLVTNKSGIKDGIIAEDGKQMSEIWKLRESITEAIAQSSSAVFKYDISLPYDHFFSIVEKAKSKLPPSFKVYSYGHVGDGNLHLNISAPDYSSESLKHVEPWVYQFTQQCNGSVSAEHGIGQLKLKYLPYSKSESCIKTMQLLKKTFDPNYILNPYKVVPLNYPQSTI